MRAMFLYILSDWLTVSWKVDRSLHYCDAPNGRLPAIDLLAEISVFGFTKNTYVQTERSNVAMDRIACAECVHKSPT